MEWIGEKLDENKKIYRYMPIARFLQAINMDTNGDVAKYFDLFMPTLHMQSDRLEGFSPEVVRESWQEKYPQKTDDDLNNLEKQTTAKLKLARVSCWAFEQKFQPWRAIAYGANVIVSTTIGKLTKALNETSKHQFYAGRVVYGDLSNHDGCPIKYAFQKAPMFSVETGLVRKKFRVLDRKISHQGEMEWRKIVERNLEKRLCV